MEEWPGHEIGPQGVEGRVMRLPLRGLRGGMAWS